MKPIILAISGPSGSGKTFLSKFLQREMNIPVIVSTTTRPKRTDEKEGEDYFFVNSTRAYKREDMLTHAKFGQHEYFALRKQLPRTGFCTYVVEGTGSKALKRSAGENYGVFTVCVQCKPEIRIERGVAPERIERDRARKDLSFEWVDYAIYNNGSIAQFEQAARDMMKVLEQWQHLQ